MTLTGAQATFLLNIASGHAPTGVPIPYANKDDKIAYDLERMGLVERHWITKHKKGACFTRKGAEVFSAILSSAKS